MTGCLCSIHVLREGDKSVRLLSAPSLSPEFRNYIADPDTRRSCRPIELSAGRVGITLAEDAEYDPDWAAFRREQPAAGVVKSFWSVPVLGNIGEPVAVIAGIYLGRVPLSAEAVSGLESLALICAIAVERDRRDAVLLASMERFALLDLVSPAGKFQFCEPGGPMTVNKRWQEITGLAGEQASAEGWLTVVHPDDADRIRSAWRQAVDARSGFSAEYRLVRPDRAVVWVLGQATPAGEHGYFGTILDITAQKTAEEALRASEARFRTLANNISPLAWMANEKGSVFWYNQRWYDYTGTTFDDMERWGWHLLLHPDHVRRVVDGIQHAWDSGQNWEDTFPLRGRDGNYRWFLSRALPIRDSLGRVERWFGTNTDVTNLRELEDTLQRQNDALRRSNEELSRFAYVASHDLQEPLRTISNYTQLIQRRYGNRLDESATTFFAHLVGASKRLSALISDLLAYSRASTGESRPFQPVDLYALATQVLADCRTLLEISRGKVLIGPLPHVSGDETQLAQVLLNLITNSLKYRREGIDPEVRIDSERIGAHYLVRVHDNGQGFSPEYADQIFGIFKRLHGQEIAGTGMGLAISKAIVERHGGQIGAEGRPGAGAMIWFTLPVP